jgi:hypothetical protein
MHHSENSQLTMANRMFNCRLSKARRYIECTFGILASRWRILHRPLNVEIQAAENIIKACCVLQNNVAAIDSFRFEDTLTVPRFENEDERNVVRGRRLSLTIRDQFANYFVGQKVKLRSSTTKYKFVTRLQLSLLLCISYVNLRNSIHLNVCSIFVCNYFLPALSFLLLTTIVVT